MRRRVLFLLLLAVAVSSGTVSAEPLRVTGGVFLLDIEGDLFTLSGAGFTLTTIGPNGREPLQSDGLGIHVKDRGITGLCSPRSCSGAEGSLVDWSFETLGGEQLLGRGTAVFDGVAATNVDFVGSMRFDAVPTPLSSGGTGDFDFEGPFSFEAVIRGIRGGEELFARRFTGSGRVIANYEGGITSDVFSVHDDTIEYQFEAPEPIPEPATLLLLSSGLSARLLWKRRRQGVEPS